MAYQQNKSKTETGIKVYEDFINNSIDKPEYSAASAVHTKYFENLKYSDLTEVSYTFKFKIISIADKFSLNPDDLMDIMFFESFDTPNQVSFSPSVKNESGNFGLLQFYSTIQLEIEMSKAKAMTREQQLDVVDAYLADVKKRKGTFSGIEALYLAVHRPVAYGKTGEDIIYSITSDASAYKGNASMDSQKEGEKGYGEITVNEAVNFMRQKAKEKYDYIKKIRKK